MLFRVFSFLAAICTLILMVPLGAWAEESESQEPPPRYTRQMVLIIIDGLQADALQKAPAPNINGVAAGGVRINNCIPVWPSGLEAAAASIITGADPAAHRFYQPGDQPAQSTLFELVRKNKLTSGFFDASGRLENLGGSADYRHLMEADDQLVEAAIKEMKANKPYLNVLVLTGTRKVLSESGRDSQEYYRAISSVDNLVGRVIHHLQQHGRYDQTLVVITGTDGEPPLILRGFQFKNGAMLPPAALVDIAPTLGYILNLEIPGSSGLVLWNAFDPGSLQNGFYLMEQRIRELSQAQAQAHQLIRQLQEDGRLVQQEKREMAVREADVVREIAGREAEIGRLARTITVMKYLMGTLVVLFGIGYLVEYRLLKKRFLLF